MANIRVAHRYAEALMGAAEEQQNIDRTGEDLKLLQTTIKGSKEFLLFLKSPVITKEKKSGVLGQLFAKKIHSSTMLFLNLLTEKGREDILPSIIDKFFRLRDEKRGIVNVEVKAAVELAKEHDAELQRRFEGYTKKKVRITYSLDRQLKGGFVARIGDTMFDGSIKRQLEILREQFTEGSLQN